MRLQHGLLLCLTILLTGCGQKPLKERAEAGDAEAQFQLGCMLIEGRGVPKDTEMGVAWLKKAEKQGVAGASTILRETQMTTQDKAIAVVQRVADEAKTEVTRTILSGWLSGVIRYRQAYGFYPGFGSATYPVSDKAFLLTGETGAVFVKTLSGRNPDGSTLSTGSKGDRGKYNRNSEAFVDFQTNDFAVRTSDNQSADLVTRCGKRVHVAIDYNGDGFIRDLANVRLPSALKSAGTSSGYKARVIAFEDVAEGEEDTACFSAQ